METPVSSGRENLVNPWVKYGIVGAAALIAWSVSRNIDGPIVHFVVTALAAWLVWKHVGGI